MHTLPAIDGRHGAHWAALPGGGLGVEDGVRAHAAGAEGGQGGAWWPQEEADLDPVGLRRGEVELGDVDGGATRLEGELWWAEPPVDGGGLQGADALRVHRDVHPAGGTGDREAQAWVRVGRRGGHVGIQGVDCR